MEKVLEYLIKAIMEFAIPSMNPDDFTEMETLLNKLQIHYNKIAEKKQRIKDV